MPGQEVYEDILDWLGLSSATTGRRIPEMTYDSHEGLCYLSRQFAPGIDVAVDLLLSCLELVRLRVQIRHVIQSVSP